MRNNGKMDLGKFNLFLKMIEDEYKLSSHDLQRISQRLLADDLEFEKVWKQYRSKSTRYRNGVDDFRPVLNELIYS